MRAALPIRSCLKTGRIGPFGAGAVPDRPSRTRGAGPGRFEIPRTGHSTVALAATDVTIAGGFCPHCQLLVAQGAGSPWPTAPIRCPHCHLLIGHHRGLAEPSREPGAKGTAAGVFSRQARRAGAEEDGEPASPEEVMRAIRSVAHDRGQRADRLLMVDYQQLAVANPAIPPLRDVFEAFGSWKAARRRAAELADPTGG